MSRLNTVASSLASMSGNRPKAIPVIAPLPDISGLVVDIDFGDLDVMYQETAGTNPVVDHGDTIGLVEDKSGNGINCDNSLDPLAQRPTYDANKKAALFASTSKLNITSDATCDVANPTYVCIAQNTTFSEGSFMFNKKNNQAGTFAINNEQYTWEYQVREETADAVTQGNAIGPIDDMRRVHVLRCSTTHMTQFLDGDKSIDDAYTDNVRTTVKNRITVGGHPDVTNKGFDGYIWRFLIYNRALTDDEVSQITTWAKANYPDEYKPGTTINLSDVSAESIWVEGTTAHMVYLGSTAALHYATADISEPHNWTQQTTNIVTPAVKPRTTSLIYEGGTWYCFYDDNVAGTIRVATGSSLGTTSLTEYGTPVCVGTGIVSDPLRWVRHPSVIPPSLAPDSNWHMVVDGRSDAVDGEEGALGRATGATPLSFTLNGTPILSPSGTNDAEFHDLTVPSVKKIADNSYIMAYAGYNKTLRNAYVTQVSGTSFPHYIALAVSSDLVTWRRSSKITVVAPGAEATHWSVGATTHPAWYGLDNKYPYLYYMGTDQQAIAANLTRSIGWTEPNET